MLDKKQYQSILKKYWGFKKLKSKQKKIIKRFLKNKDTIGLLTTGYGKSICYLLPPLLTNKTIIIVSPLISLMEDQKEKLVSKGIPCSCLNSNNKNRNEEIKEILENKIRIIYTSPEYLIENDGLEIAKQLYLQNELLGFAIDEAHCVSNWGHDFRSTYLKLGILKDNFDLPIMALTATATDIVIEDIINYLKIEKNIVKNSFDRPNLFIKCCQVKTINTQVLKPYLDKYIDDKIIIYTNTRSDSDNLAEKLEKDGYNIISYHAGLNAKTRDLIQHQFNSGKANIIVSTIAFGMGIDQTIRCVLIIGAPSSLEEYYQQIGRAGRDHLPAETVLFFHYTSFKIQQHYLKNIKHPIIKKAKTFQLNKMNQFLFENQCRRKVLLEYFQESTDYYQCNNCDNCLNNTIDITKYLLYFYQENKKNNKKDKLLNLLLKFYNDNSFWNQLIIYLKKNNYLFIKNDLLLMTSKFYQFINLQQKNNNLLFKIDNSFEIKSDEQLIINQFL